MARLLWSGVLTVLVFVQVFTIVLSGIARTDSRLRDAFRDAFQSYTCVGTNARMCSGNGVCRNGACTCNSGYSGSRCEVSLFTEANIETTTQPARVTREPDVNAVNVNVCSANEAVVCSGHGMCANGQCECDPYWSGSLCELSMRGGFCKAYQDCAECTALLQQCPADCQSRANFRLVYGFPTGISFHRCRQRNIPRNCTFYFQLKHEYTDGLKEIQVRACVPEATGLTTPRGTSDDDNLQGDKDSKRGKPGNGVAKHSSDLLVVLSLILLLQSDAV